MRTPNNTVQNEILKRIEALQEELDYLKNHIDDEDVILAEDEKELLRESLEHERGGKLLNSEALRSKLRI